eukprot:7285180-Pyramimonas_sp.AAC.1
MAVSQCRAAAGHPDPPELAPLFWSALGGPLTLGAKQSREYPVMLEILARLRKAIGRVGGAAKRAAISAALLFMLRESKDLVDTCKPQAISGATPRNAGAARPPPAWPARQPSTSRWSKRTSATSGAARTAIRRATSRVWRAPWPSWSAWLSGGGRRKETPP